MTIEAILIEQNDLLRQILVRLGDGISAPAGAKAPAPKAETPQPKVEAAKPAAKAPEKPATPPTAAPQASTGPTYDDVKKAAIALAKAKPGGNAVTTLLADAFGVDHASKLKPEQWAEFIAKAQEAAK